MIKTYKKIKVRWFSLKKAAIACAVILAITAVVPDTPINAFCQKLFSFIPGVGVVESGNDTDGYISVLQEPVRVTDGDLYVEVTSAYIMDKVLRIRVKTNVEAPDTDDPEEALMFIADTPKFYLVDGDKKIKYDTKTAGGCYPYYKMHMEFYLDDVYVKRESMTFRLEGFDKPVVLSFCRAGLEMDPGKAGNMLIIGDVMVFANTVREEGILKVYMSTIADMSEYELIRFYVYETEEDIYGSGIYIVDGEGNEYMPNDEMRIRNGDGPDVFYFEIPPETNDLRLTIPQIIYYRHYSEKDIIVEVPKEEEDINIGREIELGGSRIVLDKLSPLADDDPVLPEGFNGYDCMKIDAHAYPADENYETIIRLYPFIYTKDTDGIYIIISDAAYSPVWPDDDQQGYSVFILKPDGDYKKMLIDFNVECMRAGPWEISIDNED